MAQKKTKKKKKAIRKGRRKIKAKKVLQRSFRGLWPPALKEAHSWVLPDKGKPKKVGGEYDDHYINSNLEVVGYGNTKKGTE